MDRNTIYEDSAYGNINKVEENTFTNIRNATFCAVTAVNKNAHTINAKPVISERLSKDDNSFDYVALPELIDVPYCTNLKEDPSVGDFCICIHLDRGIRGFRKVDLDDGLGENTGLNKHQLNDCVAIVGFKL